LAHALDHAISLLTEAGVRVITFAPHTTQVFQVLDLTLFGLLKRCPRYKLPFDNDNTTSTFIMKVYYDFGQTMVPPNIWGSFRAFGFEFELDMRNEPYRLLFEQEKLRVSAGFRVP
jgi:hypothetical protein